MRISPIFSQARRSNSQTAMGQAFQKTDCRKPRMSQNYEHDVFMRLAEASMRDAKIELELKTMGLI